MTTITRNKYRGTCACGAYVEAGQGYYNFGHLTCAEPITEGPFYGCPTAVAQQVLEQDRRRQQQNGIEDRTFVSDYADINAWLTGYWEKRDAHEADPEVQATRKAEADKRARQDARWATQGLKRCPRCVGHGRSDRWAQTGSTCYQCDGHGAVRA